MLWVLFRSASVRQGTSNEYTQLMFLWRNKKYQHFLVLKKKCLIWRHMSVKIMPFRRNFHMAMVTLTFNTFHAIPKVSR